MVGKRSPTPRTPKTKPRSHPMAARTKPRQGWCHDCRAIIWAATYDALPLKMDPYPLTPKGELIAHLWGLRTWLVAKGELTIWRRHYLAIRTSPTGIGGFILRDHQCGLPIPWGDERRDLTQPRDNGPGF